MFTHTYVAVYRLWYVLHVLRCTPQIAVAFPLYRLLRSLRYALPFTLRCRYFRYTLIFCRTPLRFARTCRV